MAFCFVTENHFAANLISISSIFSSRYRLAQDQGQSPRDALDVSVTALFSEKKGGGDCLIQES